MAVATIIIVEKRCCVRSGRGIVTRHLLSWATVCFVLLLNAGQIDAGIILQDETSGNGQIDFFEPTGQTFTAEDANILAIAFYFDDINATEPNGNTTMTLFSGIDPTGSGTPLLSVSQEILPSTSGFVDFDFSSVTLTPANQYTVLVERPNARWGIDRKTVDVYAGGQAILNGALVDQDMRFRVTPVPEPSTLVLLWLGMSSFFGFRFVHRRRRSQTTG